MCFEKVRDLDALVDDMAARKPWDRPYDYRRESDPNWSRKYPLHAIVERVKSDDYPTELEDIDLDEVGSLVDEGYRFDDRDDEGYTVGDYIKGCSDIEEALRKYDLPNQVRKEKVVIASEARETSMSRNPRRL